MNSNGSRKHRVARLRHQRNACFGTSGWHRVPKVRSYFGQRLLAAIRIGLCGQHSKQDGYIIDEVRQKSDPHIDRCWSINAAHCRTEERCFVNEPKPTPHSTGFSKKMSTSSVASQFLQKHCKALFRSFLPPIPNRRLKRYRYALWNFDEILCDR